MKLRRVFSSTKASNILKTAEHALVRDQINSLKRRKAAELKTKRRVILSLQNTMSEADFNSVQQATDKAESGVFEAMKRTQRKKFAALLSDKERSSVRKSTVITKSVENLSGHELTPNELSVLEKGLSFAPTPDRLPVKEIICAVEASLSKVAERDANVVRSKVSNMLTRSRSQPTNDNLTAAERKTLRDLGKRADIKILLADKGNTTVVPSAEDYRDKMSQLLDDPAYVRVDRDPTAKRERQMRSVVDDICRRGQMSEELAKKLKPSHSSAPRMYGLPKIHKEGVPLRPITSMIGSPRTA